MSISLSCDIEPLAAVMQALEQGSPYLFIDDLSIYRNPVVAKEGGSAPLEVQFTLSGYVRPTRVPASTLVGEHELAHVHDKMNRSTSQPSNSRPNSPMPKLMSTSDVSQRSHGSGAPAKASSLGAACGDPSFDMLTPKSAIFAALLESISTFYSRQSAPGMIRCRNMSNNGTVNAVSPWLGL